MDLAKIILPDGLLVRPIEGRECFCGNIGQVSRAAISNAALFDELALIEIHDADGQSIPPSLRRRMFDCGFLPARLLKQGRIAYVRSSLVHDPGLLGLASDDVVSMTTLGINGRLGNQLFQYAFLKLYSLRNGLRIQVPPWQGEKLFGFSDERPSIGNLPEINIESFGREAFGDEDLALWEQDEPPRNINFQGTFQEIPKCWSKHRAFLRRLFSLRNEWHGSLDVARKALRDEGNTLVTIHVRFHNQDPVAQPWFRDIPIAWYREFLSRLWPTLKSPILLVATDGGDGIREQFADYPQLPQNFFSVPDPSDVYADFFGMSEADILALCNSSLSRMAALIAPEPQRCFIPNIGEKRFVGHDCWTENGFWDRFIDGNSSERARDTAKLDRLRQRSIEVRLALGRLTHQPPRYTGAIVSREPYACKLCGDMTMLACVVDFNRWGGDEKLPRLPLKGWPVYYRRCETCGFVFTNFFDTWDIHRLQRDIYNEEFLSLCPDFLIERAQASLSTIRSLFPQGQDLHILDYGAANFVLGEMLKAESYRNIDRFDYFDDQHGFIADKEYHLITCFDILDRLHDPQETLDRLAKLAGTQGLVILQTKLLPEAFMGREVDWCGLGPRSGRFSTFTEKALMTAFALRGMETKALGGDVHVAWRSRSDAKLPPFLIAPH